MIGIAIANSIGSRRSSGSVVVVPVATAATGVGQTSFTANWNAFAGANYYLLDVSLNSSFSSFVGSYQNYVVIGTSQLVSGLTPNTTYYYRLRAATGIDSDAASFFTRVYTAGGTLSYTEVTATETLVYNMKAAGVWTAMRAVYPMVGASAAACAQNLKSSSFTGTFTSGWTFASTGVTPNGTSAYMNTTFKPLTNSIGQNSFAFGVYCRNNVVSKVAFGLTEGNKNAYVLANSSFGLYSGVNDAEGLITPNWTDGRGFFINSRTASTDYALFQNTTKKTRTSASLGVSDYAMLLGCYNQGPTINPANYSAIEFAFNFISDGLTDTQALNFYTAVQTFNQTLNRQVGAQVVSDADAQAYIDRVYTAGGTLTNTEASAVNQLVIDMKSAGIWTAMRAVYPMVGSSAAACAQNLKSSSFTGTFTSGWTFASTGVTGNGTSAYMDTNCNDNNFSTSSASLGVYSRTNAAVDTYDFGIYNTVSLGGSFMKLRQSGNFGGGVQSTTELGFSNSDSRGFFQLAKNGSTTTLGYKNGTQVISGTLATVSPSNTTSFLGSLNNAGSPAFGFSNKEFAFAYLGDGLSGTNMSNFYTAVQAFQTTLGRQV